jgi:hypothetical protein
MTGISMRRARRIDVTLGDVIEIDSFFQDSATTPEGDRNAVHEYVLRATADPVSQRLLSVSAEPRVLPYQECPMAVANIGRMIGTPLSELRTAVLDQLKGIDGCTHLNDALRALAEVPVLARALRSEPPSPIRADIGCSRRHGGGEADVTERDMTGQAAR